jgi:hypothetical protein
MTFTVGHIAKIELQPSVISLFGKLLLLALCYLDSPPDRHNVKVFPLIVNNAGYWLAVFRPKSLKTVIAQLWPGAPLMEPPG